MRRCRAGTVLGERGVNATSVEVMTRQARAAGIHIRAIKDLYMLLLIKAMHISNIQHFAEICSDILLQNIKTHAYGMEVNETSNYCRAQSVGYSLVFLRFHSSTGCPVLTCHGWFFLNLRFYRDNHGGSRELILD